MGAAATHIFPTLPYPYFTTFKIYMSFSGKSFYLTLKTLFIKRYMEIHKTRQEDAFSVILALLLWRVCVVGPSAPPPGPPFRFIALYL